MPLRAIASAISEHALAAASSLGMGLVSGVCYIVGTAAPQAGSVVLNGATQVQGSPYALASIVGSVIVATWLVAAWFSKIMTSLDAIWKLLKSLQSEVARLHEQITALDDKRESAEKQIAVMQAHIEECPHRDHGRRK